MLATDVGIFERKMADLAEVFDRKAPSAAALKHWFNALRDYRMDQVSSVLEMWVRNRQKMPTISEIATILAERAGRDAEARAKFEREREGKDVEKTMRSESTDRMVKATIRALKAMQDRRPSKQWAHDIIEAHRTGQPLKYRCLITGEMLPINGQPITRFQLEMANAALQGRMGKERVPGEDDEAVAA